jgi:two-component system sensor histidine kinase AlgZ
VSATDSYYLPDFCTARAVATVMVIVQLVAFALTLAGLQPDLEPGWRLLQLSLFLQWLGLMSAALLCVSRPLLSRLAVTPLSVASFALLLVSTGLLSLLAWYALRWAGQHALLGGEGPWLFTLRNLGVCAILTPVVLRYFWVQHQWRREVEREAGARFQALTARIRPHFLFNAMNTIAALIRTRPAEAERTVEDLADLFRASLADARTLVTLDEELELTRLYLRMEELRLQPRLGVEWQVGAVPAELRLPRLVLQPLVENAVRHGIEPLARGGTVRISVSTAADGCVELAVDNPRGPGDAREGNRMALDNIRERLLLAFDGHASLSVEERPDHWRALLRVPVGARPA